MLKHIKTFEDYNVNIEEDSIDEALFDIFKSLKGFVSRISTINDSTPDEEVQKLFNELFEKLSSQTNISINGWKNARKILNNLGKEKMVEFLNQAKSDYDVNHKMGYLVVSNGEVGYKKSEFTKNTNAWGGTGSNV